MPDTPEPADQDLPEDLPAAKAVPRRRWQLPLVWLVPGVAILVGIWLAIQAFTGQGPTVTIVFQSGEGIEANKTRIKYKDVDVGEVRKVEISADTKSVIVTAALNKQARDFAVEDTRFWVVKPRIAAGSVSGLGTLLSGAYIGVDAGKSTSSRSEFVGLEVPPILTEGAPGKRFTLHAATLGSLDYGSPVYFRKLPVGQVVAYDLDKDGNATTVSIFVRAPYDEFVTTNSRFWATSGLDFTVDANGLRFNTESLATLVLGGLAFGAPAGQPKAAPAAPGWQFPLYDSEAVAMSDHDTTIEYYRLVFHQSVHGLTVGAPVEFRGLLFGEVSAIGIHYDERTHRADVPVDIKVYPERLRKYSKTLPAPGSASPEIVRGMIEGGMRGQLRTANLLTGQLYVALDFFPNAPGVAPQAPGKLRRKGEKSTPVEVAGDLQEIPTVDGSLNELEASLANIARKLDKIPFDEIGKDLHTAIRSLDATLKNADGLMRTLNQEVAPEFKRAVQEARETVSRAERLLQQDSPLQVEMRDTLREVGRSAQSLRTLTDYLDRHPEALIRGRTPEDKP
ncbi:MlaD family protein [Uliginosibacterium sp. H3]|uniref:MlaD family protein n=1 Tax=Uliginosibacterium silvisoli TaxID=3114758 RepID=A0ABU6K5U4_9RHOO|nr:MlaD family protein [Uliginosibacterium sp. H3]